MHGAKRRYGYRRSHESRDRLRIRCPQCSGGRFFEKVYENALCVELDDRKIPFKQQTSIPVHYRNRIVGEYFADILVAERLIVELKAVRVIAPEHEVQLVNYLQATGIDVGLLINFGSSVNVKRKYREYAEKQTG